MRSQVGGILDPVRGQFNPVPNFARRDLRDALCAAPHDLHATFGLVGFAPDVTLTFVPSTFGLFGSAPDVTLAFIPFTFGNAPALMPPPLMPALVAAVCIAPAIAVPVAVCIAPAIAVLVAVFVALIATADLAARRFDRFCWPCRGVALLFEKTGDASENPRHYAPWRPTTGINAHPAFLGNNLLEMLNVVGPVKCESVPERDGAHERIFDRSALCDFFCQRFVCQTDHVEDAIFRPAYRFKIGYFTVFESFLEFNYQGVATIVIAHRVRGVLVTVARGDDGYAVGREEPIIAPVIVGGQSGKGCAQ
jgi:hypothetical protein